MKTRYTIALYALCLIGISSACSKSNLGPEEKLEDGKSVLIHDLAGDVDASVGNNSPGKTQRDFHTFLFRFADQKQIWLKNKNDSATYFQDKNWDLAFSSLYNSLIYVNNGEDSTKPWAANGSRHKIILLKQGYDFVHSAPSDAQFDASTLNGIGMIIDENSPGWYNYSMTSHLVQVVPDRTYALRLSDGRYAKLQFINIYKGNPPAVTDLNWPTPYFTFRYFVQQDGSKNLKTK